MITDPKALDLWRKSESDTRDAVNLFLSDAEPFKILQKLRSATAAMQEFERRAAGVKPQNEGE